MAKDKKTVIKISTFIDASTKIEGDLNSENNLKIDGRVNGNVNTLHDIVVSQSGVVNGDITANVAVIEGIVTGNITTAETVTLAPTGRIDGNIETVGLIADIGSSFYGNCKVHKKEEVAAEVKKFEIKLPQHNKVEAPKPVQKAVPVQPIPAPMPVLTPNEENTQDDEALIASELLAQIAKEIAG